MKHLFAPLLLLSALCSLAAQDMLYPVRGSVQSSVGEALINAVVAFRSVQDTTSLYPAVCDERGQYRLELPTGGYTYHVLYMGETYRPTEHRVAVDTRSVEIPTIKVSLKDHLLGEVTVTARRPFVSYDGSNTRYNLAAHPAAIGGNLLDGVRLLPGVQVNDGAGLSVFGFYNLTVAVNGQVLRLSTDEIQAYLASLSVADVESVELIRHPGPEYGTGVEAVLNIVTKRKPNEGLNAFLSADVVYRSLLSEHARVRINYNKGDWRNYLSYQFFDMRRRESLTTTIGADTTTINPHRGHTVQLGSEWQIAPRHHLGARVLGSLSTEHIDYTHTYQTNMDRKVATANLYHSLSGKRWHWSSTADYTFSKSERRYARQTTDIDGWQDRFHYIRLSTDALYRLSTAFSLQMGAIQNNSWFDNEDLHHSSQLSNDYRESNSGVYLTLRYSQGAIDTYGGVQANYDQRVERLSGMEHRDCIMHWQPYFSFAYNIARHHRLATTFQTYYLRPSFRDLMPYASVSGFLYRLGNPELRSSTRYNLSLSYSYMRAATVEINLSDERDPIVEYLTPYKGGYALTKTNLESSRYLRLIAGAPIPIIYRESGLQWFATTYLAYHLQRDRGVIQGENHDRTFHAYYIQHKESLSLPSRWYFDAQFTYYSPLFLGVYKTERQWWLDFTISKRVDDWKFSLTGYDILNTNVAKGEIVGMPTPISFTKNWYSPKITLGVSYMWGNTQMKSATQRSVDSESRLSRSANEGINIVRGE